MPKNEGTLDRIIRAIVGIIILSAAYTSLQGTWAVAGYIVGGLILLSALTGYCCLYSLMKISTNKKQKDEKNI